ncbi:GNAT family N-acetyltransferase [Polaribacter haliotis]|uniref:GNAT family N-acetyltransferase n=1 Tax=Polaribacter haliotis TaxID=1888915 RepID=A0A7L8AJD5_9FLAO|nr:GNAT family N-acetyltransferase [Polaribacter haliotis]QOD62083.1 GNAT family N-acetyltransferase [Polaribacter haliotis]
MIHFKNTYIPLTKQSYSTEEYSIVPIRFEDRFKIMEWRNEQIYHLRQDSPLTKDRQENYFNNVVTKLFDENKPEQILFSYLRNNQCIGYGGLVHINWIDKNAEISFVLKTKLETKEFHIHWRNFLKLIEKIAFNELEFHKIYTYAFDLRPHLYEVLEKSKYTKEAVLKEHCFFNQKYLDVIIHSKINTSFVMMEAELTHAKLLFDWVNDETVRDNSLDSDLIFWENHVNWLTKNIKSKKNKIFIFLINEAPIGQVRLDLINNVWLIDYSVDKNHRGMGYGTKMLKEIINISSYKQFKAEVKKQNIASLKVFKKLGFIEKINNKEDIIEFYIKK